MKAPKALVVFDGGNAPGYTAVATSLCEEGDKRCFEVWAAFEGFRSLTGDHLDETRLVRLLMSRRQAWKLSTVEKYPMRALYGAMDQPGSEFRSERYPEFKLPENQKKAVEFIKENGFTHIIGVGGNGTMAGIRSLNKLLPDIQAGFINVSVDSDIYGDIAVGYLTGVEEGAKIARGLFNDAYTHKRIYILEMMGRDSGKHALMSGASARAHLIALPGFDLGGKIFSDIVKKLKEMDHALIIVAEGYQREVRSSFLPERVDAAMYFKRQLMEYGLEETEYKRVVSEPFSRYLRGARPLHIELSIAHLKAFILFEAFAQGKTRVMPYYLGEHDSGVRSFSELRTNNTVEPQFLDLIDRMVVPSLREYVYENFRSKPLINV